MDALKYVTSQRHVFQMSSLMISFSMHVWWYKKLFRFAFFYYGMECYSAKHDDIVSACDSHGNYQSKSPNDPQHTRFGYSTHRKWGLGYDDPQTLSWKICEASKRFPHLKIGMALFNMESEDSEGKCSPKTNFPNAHGYWRADGVSSYFRQTVNQSNFIQKNPPCPL